MCCPKNYPFTIENNSIFEFTMIEQPVFSSLDNAEVDILRDQ